jgi:hypothetical protein
MNLSKETIELIEKLAIETSRNFSGFLITGMKMVLENPEIIRSANLYTEEEMFEFINWYDNLTAWDDFRGKSNEELLKLYLKTKQS